jgi:hypothetical protein
MSFCSVMRLYYKLIEMFLAIIFPTFFTLKNYCFSFSGTVYMSHKDYIFYIYGGYAILHSDYLKKKCGFENAR